MKPSLTALLVVLTLSNRPVLAASKDLGNGFRDHGVASPVANHRGIVATVDGDGRNVALAWLYDHRGGYALLMIDAETGKARQFPMPFPAGDAPYASVLSSGNKYYTHFNNHFVEFDPAKPGFTFHKKTTPQMAMGMTEDDEGTIWSVTYPQSGVAAFDPKTKTLRDFGHVYKQNWPQYQRWVAADDAGWVYFAMGNTASQLVAFDPKSAEAAPLLPEAERKTGTAYLYRDLNGKVYGQGLKGDDASWYELYKGEAKKIEKPTNQKPKPIITDSQALFHRAFPDGKVLKTCDLLEKRLAVEDPKTKSVKEVSFDYTSEGAGIMGVAVAPDGTIAGGTMFPMRFFTFDPKTETWTNRKAHNQSNTVVRQNDRFYVGGYGGGSLIEWDPSKPWVDTVKGAADTNPLFLTDCTPDIHRPHKLFAHPDGKTIVLAGTPQYGYTGGGLLFWDRESKSRVLLKHTDLLKDHSTHALAALPDNKLLGGTTTMPGTGGEKKATEAQLYVLDMASKKIEWNAVVFPGAQTYTDLCVAPDGLIYGVVDRNKFFVFDPATRKVVHERDTTDTLGPSSVEQGPRVFVHGPDGAIFMLYAKGVVRVEPKTFELKLLAESPVAIEGGGDYLDGRIYFTHGSHLYSWEVAR